MLKKIKLRINMHWLILFLFLIGVPNQLKANVGENNVVQNLKSKIVKGIVVDETGVPIVGVNILVKSSPKLGTYSDIDGKFQLKIPENVKEIIVSFIGYKERTISVAKAVNLKIVLKENSQMLESVQVVAYGTQSKISVTGSMSSVRTQELTRIPNASISNALAGSMSGVTAVQSVGQPGAEDAKLYIRGGSTLSGNDSPLVLVDGVERSFSQLDPNEVADITVLKDASATAVFGVRGANGVILVTTRRGKEGKARISVSSNISVQMPTREVETAGSYETALLYNEKLDNDNSSKARFSDYALNAFKTGSDPVIYPDTDWRSTIFKDAYLQTQHNVNISGGSKRVRYFTSVGFLHQDGMLKDFDQLDYDNQFSYNRYNYRANLDIDVTPTTLFKINIGGVIGDKHEPIGHSDGLWRQVNWASPFASPGLSKDGYPIELGSGYMPVPLKTGWAAFYGLGYQNQTNNNLNMDLNVTQKLDFVTKGLKFHIKGSYNTYYTKTVKRKSSMQRYKAYYEGSKTQTGVSLDDPIFDKDIIYEILGADTNLSYSEGYGKSRNWYMEAGFNYSRRFADKHKVTGLLLYTQNRSYYPSGGYTYIPKSYLGLVGRATYSYKNKYLFDFNVGYNGSENFAPGSTRYGIFPSGSIGWIMSEENFMKNIQFINFLKLRASYGIVGNDRIGGNRFLYMDGVWKVNTAGYNFGTDVTTKEMAATEGSLGSHNVTWEKAYKQNYGLDLKVLDNRLSLTADVFYEKRNHILISRNVIPAVVSISLPKVNMGEVKNHGYELSVKWSDKINKVQYWVKANVSYSKNKIIFMDEVDHKNPWNYKTGHSTGLTYGYTFDRFYTEDDFTDPDNGVLIDGLAKPSFGTPHPGDCKYLDKDNDGIIDVNDESYIGNSTTRPEYILGLNYGIRWKGWYLNMQWVGVENVSRNLSTEYRIPFSPSGKRALFKYHADNRWTPKTASTATMPRFSDVSKSLNYKVNSTLWLKDASYIRLKNAQLGYNFTKGRLLTKLGLQNINLYASGYNLLLFDSLDIVDPEASTSGGRANQYPVSKMFTAGVKLSF